MTFLNPHTVQRLAAVTAPEAAMVLRQACAWSVGSEEGKGFYGLSVLDTTLGTKLSGGSR